MTEPIKIKPEKEMTESESRASENPAPMEVVVEKPAAKTREEAAKAQKKKK